MAGITLAQAQAGLAKALTALDAALDAESYSISSGASSRSRSLRIDACQRTVEFWDQKVKELESEAQSSAGAGQSTYASFGVPS